MHGVASVLIRSVKGITCMMNKTKLCRAAAAALCALLLAGLILWFTLWPPELLLFRDLSATGSWLPLPC